MFTLHKKALYGDINVFDDGVYDEESGSVFFEAGVDIESIPVSGFLDDKTEVTLHSLKYDIDSMMFVMEYKRSLDRDERVCYKKK